MGSRAARCPECLVTVSRLGGQSYRVLPLILALTILFFGCSKLIVTLDDPGASSDDEDGDGWSVDEDCDDTDAALNLDDADGDGYATCEGDCDDDDVYKNPGAAEVCDGADNDCNGQVDDPSCVDCDHTVGEDFTGIQQAITDGQVQDDDAICVLPGQYNETFELNARSLHIYGLAGPYLTVVDGGAANSVARFVNEAGGGSTLHGFTLRNGDASQGGGLHVNQASPDLSELIIESNHATNAGGGVWIQDGSPVLNSVAISDNTCDAGGGGLAGQNADIELRNVRIRDNTAQGPGGGIQLRQSNHVLLDGVTVRDNHAGMGGGGLDLAESEAQITNLVVWNNQAMGPGGGIHLEQDGSTLQNAILAGNTSAQERGGGLSMMGCTTALTNLFVLGNHAQGGGGIYMDNSTPTLINLDVVSNVSTNLAGGGLLMEGNSAPVLVNVAIIRNEATNGGGGMEGDGGGPPLDANHLNCWDNTPDDYGNIPDLTGEQGNISADPLYPPPSGLDAYFWDTHLSDGSPHIDAGSPALENPDGTRSNIGAYGGPGAAQYDLDGDGAWDWWTPGPYPGGDADCDDRRRNIHPQTGC